MTDDRVFVAFSVRYCGMVFLHGVLYDLTGVIRAMVLGDGDEPGGVQG